MYQIFCFVISRNEQSENQEMAKKMQISECWDLSRPATMEKGSYVCCLHFVQLGSRLTNERTGSGSGVSPQMY